MPGRKYEPWSGRPPQTSVFVQGAGRSTPPCPPAPAVTLSPIGRQWRWRVSPGPEDLPLDCTLALLLLAASLSLSTSQPAGAIPALPCLPGWPSPPRVPLPCPKPCAEQCSLHRAGLSWVTPLAFYSLVTLPGHRDNSESSTFPLKAREGCGDFPVTSSPSRPLLFPLPPSFLSSSLFLF